MGRVCLSTELTALGASVFARFSVEVIFAVRVLLPMSTAIYGLTRGKNELKLF